MKQSVNMRKVIRLNATNAHPHTPSMYIYNLLCPRTSSGNSGTVVPDINGAAFIVHAISRSTWLTGKKQWMSFQSMIKYKKVAE